LISQATGMGIRNLCSDDIPSLWRINEEGLPGTGKVSQEEIADLLTLSELSLGAYEDGLLTGFVICLLPRTRYGSLNYAWFNENYQDFLYVDRIAVSQKHRNKQIGSLLYERVFKHASELKFPVAAEVSLKPPNPDSMRFHERHKFSEAGILHHESMSVTMLIRNPVK
jgi:predicted GNAT superfamily acetyltransferase